MSFRREVSSSSTRPKEAMQWVLEIEQAKPMAELAVSKSITGISTYVFETLGYKLARGVSKILNGDFN